MGTALLTDRPARATHRTSQASCTTTPKAHMPTGSADHETHGNAARLAMIGLGTPFGPPPSLSTEEPSWSRSFRHNRTFQGNG